MPRRQYDENTLLISREERFLQKDVFRIDVTAKECMSWIGKTIGSLVLNSFKNDAPIKEVCLYGNYGSGKSFLANEILQGLSNSNGQNIKGRSRFNDFPMTFPKCRHVDWWMWRRNAMARKMLPEYRRPILLKDEFLIGEWCSEIPSTWLEVDRLDIEISCGSTIEWALKRKFIAVPSLQEIERNVPAPQWNARVAAIIGFGNGTSLIEAIAELPEFMQFKIVK